MLIDYVDGRASYDIFAIFYYFFFAF